MLLEQHALFQQHFPAKYVQRKHIGLILLSLIYDEKT